MHPTDNQNGLAVIESLWPRLRDADRLALTTLALSASGTSCPVAPRRRHRHYSPDEIRGLKVQLAAEISKSPTLPNHLLAQRLGLPLSSFKALGLHHWAKKVLQTMAAPPRSAVAGYGGACAAEGTCGPDS